MGLITTVATMVLAAPLMWMLGNDSARLDLEERAVIAAFMNEILESALPDERLVLAQRTMEASNSHADFVREKMPAVRDEALRDCLLRSQETVQFDVGWPDGRQSEYIDWDGRNATLKNLDKEARVYSHIRFLRFSRVGFSPERDQAIFQFEQDCGVLCGSGDFILMKKEGTTWTIAGSVNIWVS